MFEFDIRVGDGVLLRSRYYPVSGGVPRAVVFIRCAELFPALEFADGLNDLGWPVVVQSVRGCGSSEGAFVPFSHEIQDARDSLSQLCSSEVFEKSHFYFCGRGYSGYCGMAGVLSSASCENVRGGILSDFSASQYHHGVCSNGVLRCSFLHQLFRWCGANASTDDFFPEINEWSDGHSPLSFCAEAERWLLQAIHTPVYDDFWKREGMTLCGRLSALPRHLRIFLHSGMAKEDAADGIQALYCQLLQHGFSHPPQCITGAGQHWSPEFVHECLKKIIDDEGGAANGKSEYLMEDDIRNDAERPMRFYLHAHRLAVEPPSPLPGRRRSQSDFVVPAVNQLSASNWHLSDWHLPLGYAAYFYLPRMEAGIPRGYTPCLRLCCASSPPGTPLIAVLFARDTQGHRREISRGAIYLGNVHRRIADGNGGEAIDVRLRMHPCVSEIRAGEEVLLRLSGADPPRYLPAPPGVPTDSWEEARNTACASLFTRRACVRIAHDAHCPSFIQFKNYLNP